MSECSGEYRFEDSKQVSGLIRRSFCEIDDDTTSTSICAGSDSPCLSDLEHELTMGSTPTDKSERTSYAGKPVWSSGVAFYPPSDKYWRIGGKWYDFKDFLHRHPGGPEVLLLLRDRFEDSTFAFESHHLNYTRARLIIKQYEVSEDVVMAHGVRNRPFEPEYVGHRDQYLDSGSTPRLLGDEAFYSVLRRRVANHLRSQGYAKGGPTVECKLLFWATFALWLYTWTSTVYCGSFGFAFFSGLAATWLGAFGHNWVHQPGYRLWAMLSLEAVGLSSSTWFRDHNLQHHMYTNTPWDNHFEGTAPFLVTDPTVQRNFLQARVTPYLNPLVLSFGLVGNYAINIIEIIRGNENLNAGKIWLPLQYAVMIYRWGFFRGFWLQFVINATLGVYYFSIALMNHNAEHCHNVEAHNKSKDWGIAQINSSADWAVTSSFLSAGRYLWLNYHTVHHLFPLVDFSHHPALQHIVAQTCAEFDVFYRTGTATDIYCEMVKSFAHPRALMQEVLTYAGGF